MSYRELPAPPALAGHVACLWVAGSGSGGPSRILPDGCADVVWTGRKLVVAGPSTRAFTAAGTPSAPHVGVRFRTGAAGAALRYPMHELRDRSPQLSELVPGLSTLAERVADAQSPDAQLAVLAQAMQRRLAAAGPADPVVRSAVLALARPRSRVSALDLALSERQLRRRFQDEVGYGPRMLARILRLQRLLRLARSGAAGGALAGLATAAGYADQAHLSRELRTLTGVTPSGLLSGGVTPTGDAALHDQARGSSGHAVGSPAA
ncbi:DUF6597 domain-containing transcriptional factor [Dactylosporangium matsuzakiense]|uniref:AraC family transcriptional regulator n=1 Tax=Dactylosporangium matsuzakiense TaxID=53360 RepID=A0A9W6NNS4_9ACTN|nr:DUF6597 domain-containing transcriptional factor [Dactylosporangium matsuzakiense]UWZ48051.1 helix-turn-helix domain-containing protein [Dactylosporangium matsuzakiense]GLL03538.1 AraC family transcriptional regulator [Dactylosporangium matsuzakiense]